MFPFVSCKAFRQSPIGAPDFSRSSFTSLASIFSLTVVISLPSYQLSVLSYQFSRLHCRRLISENCLVGCPELIGSNP
jgi:hypothetical protein